MKAYITYVRVVDKNVDTVSWYEHDERVPLMVSFFRMYRMIKIERPTT